MYLRYYGLREAPFELTANPRFLFMTAQHSEALANLTYGLSSAKPVTLLIGEAGTGKTTLLRAALDAQSPSIHAVHLTNPGLSRAEFVETLARSFDLGLSAQSSKATLLTELECVLRERRKQGEITALVVDEAQRLNAELLEEVRLLANIETDTEKLLPLVLAGQPELAARLNEQGFRQLKQRVALRCEIRPFSLSETAAYIASRIRTAGGDAARLFTREAVMLIHECSHGIPRTISVVCDNALISGFAAGRQPVGRDLIEEIAHDFDLKRAVNMAAEPGIVAGRIEPQPPKVAKPTPSETTVAAAESSPEVDARSDRRIFADVGKRRPFSLFGRS
jgi:type II secretory pathway predicted ATPase ExeA